MATLKDKINKTPISGMPSASKQASGTPATPSEFQAPDIDPVEKPEEAVQALGSEIEKLKQRGDLDYLKPQQRAQFDQYAGLIDQLKQEREDVKKNYATAALIDGLGKALLQIGAGIYAGKQGVSVQPGAVGPMKDWEKDMRATRAELGERMADYLNQRQRLLEQGGAERRAEAGTLEKRRERSIADALRARELAAKEAKQDKRDAEERAFRKEMLAQKAVKEQEEKPELKLNKAELARDAEYAKTLGKRQPASISDAEKNVDQIDWAINQLEAEGNLTGGVKQFLPQRAREVIDRKSVAVQETVEQVVQRGLRQTLGAQFTEKEGERLISRAYNPRLSEEENVRRLKSLKDQMNTAIANEKAAEEYFTNNGTLKGFDRKLYRNADDFRFENKSSKPEMTLEQKRKRLEELRKKAGR